LLPLSLLLLLLLQIGHSALAVVVVVAPTLVNCVIFQHKFKQQCSSSEASFLAHPYAPTLWRSFKTKACVLATKILNYYKTHTLLRRSHKQLQLANKTKRVRVEGSAAATQQSRISSIHAYLYVCVCVKCLWTLL